MVLLQLLQLIMNAIAANDRNGLRPLRYAITKDKFLFAGSETGMIELNEKRIQLKGRLGPVKLLE